MSSHLISVDLNSSELSGIECDPVCRGCERARSDKAYSSIVLIDRSQANWVGRASQRTQLRREMRSDEMR